MTTESDKDESLAVSESEQKEEEPATEERQEGEKMDSSLNENDLASSGMSSTVNEQDVLENMGRLCNFRCNLAVIILHPWGLLGGDMNNNVVSSVSKYFQSRSITTLRLNFKGMQVGWGYAEIKQVKMAASFLLNSEEVASKPTKILIVGYSYGSFVGASASADIPECIGYVSIAPPFGVSHWLFMFNSSYHLKRAKMEKSNFVRLLMIGTSDNFTSESMFQKVASTFPKDTTTQVIQGLDHFFAGRENEVVKVIDAWYDIALSRLL